MAVPDGTSIARRNSIQYSPPAGSALSDGVGLVGRLDGRASVVVGLFRPRLLQIALSLPK